MTTLRSNLQDDELKPWDSDEKKQQRTIEKYIRYGGIAIDDAHREHIKDNIKSRGLMLPRRMSNEIWSRIDNNSNLMELTYPKLRDDEHQIVHDVSVVITLPYDLLEDRSVDIFGEITKSVEMAMGSGFDDMFLRGNGVNRPLGIYKNSKLNEKIVALDYVKENGEWVPNYSVFRVALQNVYDEAMKGAYDGDYFVWIMNEEVRNILLDFDRDAPDEDYPKTLLGFDVVCTEYGEDFIHNQIPVVLMCRHHMTTRRNGNVYVNRHGNDIHVIIPYNIEYWDKAKITKVRVSLPEESLYRKIGKRNF